MANTRYKELADKFFSKIKEQGFAQMNEQTVYEIAIGYIAPACNQFQSCTQNLSNRDDTIAQFNYELTHDNKEMLVNYMVIEWLTSNYILTTQALKSRLSTADFHSLQQSNMLGKALELRDTLMSENNQLAINKSYRQSKLFDIVKGRGKKVTG